VFSHGLRDTRETFAGWNEQPWSVLRGWLALSLAIALTLLGAVWVVSGLLTPDITPIHLAGFNEPSHPSDLVPILWRNSLVLALHATACVAGFIAGASMPIAAAQRTGLSRWIHVKAGELAILFVCAVTLFSLSTQALYLGMQGSTIAYQLEISRGVLILTVLPHALLELGGLADRQPEGRVEPAAGGDRRHRAARDPGAGDRGDDRGLHLASHPRAVLLGRPHHPRRVTSTGYSCRAPSLHAECRVGL
jgi:hypothetical protein